eukprot:GILJ01044668.1.p1 GENE.GILJ01044668.1~~GILJ01044668.1.p1  ORF type:complete len:165 (+),score=29.06 GILJ01044668.1:98-592(+)
MSLVYLEGPTFSEEQAHVGRAIAAVRAESKVDNAQHATQVQSLMDELRSLKELVMKSQKKQAKFQEATNSKLSELVHNQRLQADKLKNFSLTKQPDAIKEQADARKGAQLESGFKAQQQSKPIGGYNVSTDLETVLREQRLMARPGQREQPTQKSGASNNAIKL